MCITLFTNPMYLVYQRQIKGGGVAGFDGTLL